MLNSQSGMITPHTAPFWHATLALCLGSFMVFANLYVTQPLLPMISEQFAVSPLHSSVSFTISTLTLGISLLFYGPLSDAIGRKGIMLLTMVGITLTTASLALASSYQSLLLLRALQGFFLAGLPAIAVAYMSDEFNADALMIAVGIYISGNSLGGIGGRLLGGFLGENLGLTGTFACMALLSLLLTLAFAWLLPKSQHFAAKPLRAKPMLRQLWAHLANKRLLLSYLIGGLSFFIFVNQYSYITFVLKDNPYSLSAQYIGLLFLTYLSGTYASAISGKLGKRFSQPNCMMAGTVIIMLGSGVTLIPSLYAIILGLLINAFGFFLTHSTASSWVSLNAQGGKASASSLYLTFYYVGASTGGIYLSIFWQQAQWTGVVIGSWLMLLVILWLGFQLQIMHKRLVTTT
ncbi:major facilitator transporter [Paraglaciecola polaris LMG 21857]|uniref:Major facilitator transporter n=2 Tax=Paraglaciecola polaris TaxID=222814 RepID=K6ZAC6_9ALTE|nr:MFS transporter [Paraglaciecola polaris]GAC33091.1 major facilitator transporter [Paraglaciecola polaris LMG 21857]